MINKTAIIVVMILALTLVSAQEIKISPDKLNLNVTLGVIEYRNITVSTQGTQAVRLSYEVFGNSSNVNIVLIPSEPFVVENEKEIMVGFQFANDVPSGDFRVNLIASTDIIVRKINVGGGGGGGGSAKIVEKEVEVLVDSIVTKEVEVIREVPIEIPTEVPVEVPVRDSASLITIAFLIVIIMVLIAYTASLSKKQKKGNKKYLVK